ncbi:MAG TPA: protein-glutamate O-methyltransferase CheR [Fibrobacteraceae bacterium]|nr:protein-glutamate O-methyltransferase CheR [Fibrobacteraceae bacterium]
MNSEIQKIISEYVLRVCGIVLGPEKAYLLEQRLNPLLPEFQCTNFEELAHLLSSFQGTLASVRDKIIMAITTNETSFFRDGSPWKMLAEVILPYLAQLISQRKARIPLRRGAKVRIWSAASSTGQEPYSIAMSILEVLRMRQCPGVEADDFEILATDVSPRVLAKAIQGRYQQQDVARGLQNEMLSRYFVPMGENEYQAKEGIRRLVEFRNFNLTSDLSRLGAFDLIFCRNVLIYFSEEVKKTILRQMHAMLSAEGVLILGSAENLYNLNDGFTSIHHQGSVYYRKRS